MRSVVASVLFVSLAYCGVATQTDWSGGAGVAGPVLTLGSEYFLDTDVSCANASNLVLQTGRKNTVAIEFGGACSVVSADFNGDGYLDIIGAARYDDKIAWWENSDGSGTIWIEHIIDDDFNMAFSMYTSDLNGDGYMDVLGATLIDDDIIWWENSDGSGTTWVEHTVDSYFDGAHSVYSSDVNGDGYLDVLGAAYYDDDITWWENADGSGTTWIEHTIDNYFKGANSVYSSDVNGDGHMDVLGAAHWDNDNNEITWWENTDGSGTTWVEHTIDNYFRGANSVYSSDVNGDGHMDVLGAARYDNDITWWENTDGSGTNWVEHTIDGEFCYATSVYSKDINGDGYIDVLGAADNTKEIAWWENLDGSGTSWSKHTVDDLFSGAQSVYAADINQDGNMDILGAAMSASRIAWWDFAAYHPEGSLESSILDVESNPDWQWIDWICSTPTGTSVSFQVRASDDYLNMGTWSDTLSFSSSLEGILTDNHNYFQYRAIMQTTNSSISPVLNDITILWNPSNIGETTEPISPAVSLLSIAPNPSAGPPVIRLGLPEPGFVGISIFDLSGRLVSEVHVSEYSSGYHDVQLIGRFSPGIYFCKMTSDDLVAEQRFVVVK